MKSPLVVTPFEEILGPEEPADFLPAVEGSDATSVQHYDPEVKIKAYDLYMTSDLTPEEIAVTLSIPVDVVVRWRANHKWRERKLAVEEDLMEQADTRYKKILLKQRLEVTERHLRIAKQLEELIEKTLTEQGEDGQISVMDIRRLSEALSSATGVSARAAAITDRNLADMNQAAQAKANSKVPLVAIGINVQPAPQ